MLVNPCYYKNPSLPSNGAAFYNELHNWDYDRLAEVFGSAKTPMVRRLDRHLPKHERTAETAR